MTDVTRVLSAIEQGAPQAAEQLLPLVYDELRRLAAEKMAQEKPGQTLDHAADHGRLAAARRAGQQDILWQGSGSVAHTVNLPVTGTRCYDGCGNRMGP
jgi:hypothetical protein